MVRELKFYNWPFSRRRITSKSRREKTESKKS